MLQFKHFDTDANLYISSQELVAGLSQSVDRRAALIMKRFDVNSDASLSQEEIKRAQALRQSGGSFKRLDPNQARGIDEPAPPSIIAAAHNASCVRDGILTTPVQSFFKLQV